MMQSTRIAAPKPARIPLRLALRAVSAASWILSDSVSEVCPLSECAGGGVVATVSTAVFTSLAC